MRLRNLLLTVALLGLAATTAQAQSCPSTNSNFGALVANVGYLCELNPSNAGVVAGSNTTAVEYGTEGVHKTVITFAARAVTCTDEAGVVLHCGTKVYDMPDGVIVFIGASFDGTVLATGNLTATADGDIGVGTVTASNNSTLATTEQNIIPSTSIAQLVDSTGPADAWTTTAIALVEGWASADADIYLNMLWDDADHNGGGVTVTGTLTISWINLNAAP